MKVKLEGDGYYVNLDTGLLFVRLTRIQAEPTDTYLSYVVTETEYVVEEDVVYFTFPSGIFKDKDWLTVELTFDNITWALALEDRIVVFKQPELTQVRPLYSYANKANNEVFLEVGELPNTRGGDIWDTSLYGYLKCKYVNTENAIEELVSGYFVNKTMIGCPLPVFTQKMTVLVDFTFDNGNTYTV